MERVDVHRGVRGGNVWSAGLAARMRRGLRDRLVCALALVAAALAVACSPAFAFSQRGHSSDFTLGSPGAGLGSFAAKVGPAGVAVSESTGDLYVVDPGNSRVEQFSPPGASEGEPNTPVAAWGWGVADGKAEYEVCTSGCQQGIAGTGEGQFDYPKLKPKGTERSAIAIAVDNSSGPSKGDVYVVSNTASEESTVEKFGPNGEKLGRVKIIATGFTKVGGLAVQANGELWVQAGAEMDHLGELERFKGDNPNTFVEAVPADEVKTATEEEAMQCPAPGLAVDASGETLYLDHERLSLELEKCTPEEEEEIKAEKREHKENGEPEVTRKAIQTVVAAKLGLVSKPEVHLVAQTLALDRESTSAIATDESTAQQSSGDVYIANLGEVNEKPVASVAVFNANGEFVQRFGQKTVGASTGIAVDSPAGTEPGAGDIYVSDWKKGRVDVFKPELAGPPLINEQSAVDIEPKETELKAQIDPRGEATTYWFEYGTTNCQLPEAACTKTTEATTAAVFGDVAVSAKVAVEPAKTYFFRVRAKNKLGEAVNAEGPEGKPVVTPRTLHTFTTLPQAAGLLPDGRAWEMVSEPNKEGATLEAIGGIGGGGGTAPSVGLIQGAEDGNAITYTANTASATNAEGNRSPESQQIISKRKAPASPTSAGGWSSLPIETPELRGLGLPLGQPEEYQAFSTLDLSLGLLRPVGPEGSALEEPALAHEGEQRNIFVRHNFTSACESPPAESSLIKAGCYEPLVTTANDKVSTKFGANFEILGTAPDLGHIVFRSGKEEEPLVTEGGPAANFPHLYEWSAADKGLKLVDVLPGGEAFTSEQRGAGLGGERENETDNARNAISQDGSRVFWTGSRELYMRDMVGGRTLHISEPEPGLEPADLEHGFPTRDARFQGASANGEVVFFTDDIPLTSAALLRAQAEHENERPPYDLYACRVVEVAEKLKCVLTDLTVDRHANLGENAEVTGLVLGEGGEAGEGTYVYFVTGGALTPDAKPGRCSPPAEGFEARCNLYLEHLNTAKPEPAWEEPKLIANISAQDAGVWGNNVPHLFQTTSRVSPNGRFLAFMSNSSLTGYDNRDINTGALDEEVFLYDGAHETLVCASCNPSKARPAGVLDTAKTSEGNGLLVDRPEVWLGRTLAGSIPTWTYTAERHTLYQSRYLTDEGRLFFNSPDQLVTLPEEEKYVNKENVYEYEPNGAGTCASSSGCVALLSGGTSARESAFLDASSSGKSVFFLTAARLVAADQDESLDVYSAHVCGSGAEECVKSAAAAPRPCETTKTCRAPGESPPGLQVPATSASGNVAKTIVRGETVSSPPSPKSTNARKLKAALKKCHKLKKKKKRHACERVARKHYGAKKASRHLARGRR